MRLRLRRPVQLGRALRDLARRRPSEAEQYLDAHQEEWGSLAEANPHDAADILEALGEEAAIDLLVELEPDEAAEILEEMRPGAAAGVLEELPLSDAALLLNEMGPSEAADIVAELGPEARQAVIEELAPQVAGEVLELLEYPADSAGGLMRTDPATLRLETTAGEAIESLRLLHQELGGLSYVYIVDPDRRLRGVLSFRDLVFAPPQTPLEDVMVHETVAVTPDTDREEVAEIIRRYGLLGLPVVDNEGTLLGMIDIEEVIEAVQQEASEDMATMMGAGAEETVFTSVSSSIRMRLPWIVVNLATAFLAAVVVSYFEPVISRLAILAAYMPVVASMGGNSGAQSLAVVIRSLAMGDVPDHYARRVIRRELLLGLANGLAIAVLSGAVAWTFTEDPRIGVVIGVAAWVNMTVAGAAGSGIPIALERLGLDPALASNIFLTTVTDVVGFGGFLAIATLML